jgi:hypothetical protein
VTAATIPELEADAAAEPSIERLQRMAALLTGVPATPAVDERLAARLASALPLLELGPCPVDITEPRVRELWQKNAREWLNGQLVGGLNEQFERLVSDARRERQNQGALLRLETTRDRTLRSLVALLEELSSTR